VRQCSRRAAQRDRGVAGLDRLCVGESLLKPFQADGPFGFVLGLDPARLFVEIGDGPIRIPQRKKDAASIAVIDGFGRLEPQASL